MPNPPINRRQAMAIGAAGALGFWSAARVSAAPQEPGTQLPPLQFSANIPGLPEASRNIREIHIDELTVSPPKMTTGRDNEFWDFKPGALQMGAARFTIGGSPGAFKELRAWFQDAAAGGKNIRKNITVNLRRADGRTERTYALYDCFPTQWSSVNFDTSSTVQTETLRVKVGRIEFKT